MRILTLVGPKGCGKTHIGRLVEKKMPHATFLEVESIAIDFVRDNGGSTEVWKSSSMRASFYDQVRNKIQELVDTNTNLQHDDSILIMESTGAAPESKSFLEDFRNQFNTVLLVRVRSSAETCAKRIQSRDASKHVDVPIDMIRAFHVAAEALD